MFLFPGISAPEDSEEEFKPHRLSERYARIAEQEVMEIQRRFMETKQYRKKPVVIEAFQITEEIALGQFCDNKPLPFGVFLSGSYHQERRTVTSAYAFIDTLEGSMRVSIGDWIIKGVKGELCPCKPDIFAATYEDANIPDPAAAITAMREALEKMVECFDSDTARRAFTSLHPNQWTMLEIDACHAARKALALASPN
jgi:hypothetical protein